MSGVKRARSVGLSSMPSQTADLPFSIIDLSRIDYRYFVGTQAVLERKWRFSLDVNFMNEILTKNFDSRSFTSDNWNVRSQIGIFIIDFKRNDAAE